MLRDGITMNDVKKCRLENTNKENKMDRKYFKFWVGSRSKDECEMDLFFFQDVKKQHAMKELLEERAKEGDYEATEATAEDVPAADTLAALPRAMAKTKAKAEDTVPSRSKELLRKMKELTWEYEGGLMVVDTFSKKIAMVPMKTRGGGGHSEALTRSSLQKIGWESRFNLIRRKSGTDLERCCEVLQTTGHCAPRHSWTRPSKEMDSARAKARANVVERRE